MTKLSYCSKKSVHNKVTKKNSSNRSNEVTTSIIIRYMTEFLYFAKKRIAGVLAGLLIFVLLIPAINLNADIYRRQCGDDVYLVLDTSTGVLQISGTGPIYETAVGTQSPLIYFSNYEINSVIIENGVTNIPSYFFRDLSSLTSIIIPDSVTSIGHNAFRNCSSLTTITIPDSVTYISTCVTYGCDSLTSIIVDERNTVYDSRNNCNAIIETANNTLISGCKNTLIPDSVTRIGECAFAGLGSLTTITIPDSVTYISTSCVTYGCDSLTSIIVDERNTVYDSRNNCNAIIETANNTLISGCKNTLIPDSVTRIGEWAFAGLGSLTAITIPDSVTMIDNCAFADLGSLTAITIPDSVTNIGGEAFRDCYSLTSIIIPDSVTSIGHNAFVNVPLLTIYCDNTIINSDKMFGAKALKISHHVSEGTTVEPTCTNNGSITGTCAVCGQENVQEILSIDPYKHLYNSVSYHWSEDNRQVTAEAICAYNNEHKLTETQESIKSVLATPTCTDPGFYHYEASFDNEMFSTQNRNVIVDPLGHDYEAIQWEWNDYEIVTVDLVCKNDNNHTLHLDATITSAVTTEPSCEITGIRTYTASVTIDGKTFTDTKEEVLNAIGHEWGTPSYTWTEDSLHVTAEVVCGRENSHKITETVDTTYVSTATCTEAGTTTYTATFTNEHFRGQTKTVTGEPLGHQAAAPVEEGRVEPTCTDPGHYDSVVYCERCHAELSRETVEIPAAGHNWGSPTWEWKYGYNVANLVMICNNDTSHRQVFEADVTRTIDSNGQITYTASAVVNGRTYTAAYKRTKKTNGNTVYGILKSDGDFVITFGNKPNGSNGQIVTVTDSYNIQHTGKLFNIGPNGFNLAGYENEVKAIYCFGAYNNTSTAQINLSFANLKNLVFGEITFAGVGLSGLFENCTSLETAIVNAYSIKGDGTSYMFAGCSKLSNLDISDLDTSNVTDMSGMFSGCSSLTTLYISHINTAKVYSMSEMFANCSSLTALNISGFNTDHVEDWTDMFSNDYMLSDVVLGNQFGANWGENSWRTNYQYPGGGQLPQGYWKKGNIIKSDLELAEQYKANATSWAGQWTRILAFEEVNMTKNGIEFVWTPVAGASTYTISKYYCKDKGGGAFTTGYTKIGSTSGNSFIYKFPNVKAGKSYIFKISTKVGNKTYTLFWGEDVYNPFADVDENTKCYSAVNWAFNNRIVNGLSGYDDRFGPNESLQRQQFAIMLWKFVGQPSASGNKTFHDMADLGSTAKKAIKWAAGKGIIAGVNGNFMPYDDLTREQIIIMLWRLAGKPKASGQWLDALNDDFDETPLSSTSAKAINWAISKGVIQIDYSEGDYCFRPKDPCTRGEMCMFLKNFNSKVKKYK